MVFRQNQNLRVWFRCQLCRGSFPTVNKFMKHKEQWHLAEFQKFNFNCITFEEATRNQEHVGDKITATTTVNTYSDVSSRSQTVIQAGLEPEPVPENEVAVLQGTAYSHILTASLHTAKKENEIVQLITYDDNDEEMGSRMIKVERTHGQTFSQVNKPFVLVTRLTVKEIQDALQKASRPSLLTPKLNPSSLSKRKSKSLKCPKGGCFKIFKTLWSRNRHLATYIKSTSNGRQEDRPFHCTHPGCRKSFKRKDGLKCHLETHADPRHRRPFSCQICSKVFYRLDKHYREVHGNKRPFPCPQPGCMKSFKRKEVVTAHLETHTDPRNRLALPCQICSKTCLGKQNLYKHCRRMHRNDLPFSCP